MSIKETIKENINLEKLKAHPKAVLATVAIASVTVGFAGGVGIGKLSTTSSQANQLYSQENMPPEGNNQGMMPPGRGGRMEQGMTPPDQNGQGMTPPDTTSGATESHSDTSSNTSSDEINELKERNKEIKSQIESSSQ